MNPSELAATVVAVNRAHAYANQMYAQLVEIFKPMLGTAILKQDGTLLAKVKKLLVPEFPCTPALSVYRHHSDYYLCWMVKTCEGRTGIHPDCQIANYYEIGCYIGNFGSEWEGKGNILVKLSDPPANRTDYTLQEIQEKQQKAKEAKSAYESAKSACYPFGE